MAHIITLVGMAFLATSRFLPKKKIQIIILILGLFFSSFGVFISWQNDLIAQRYTYIKSVGLLGQNYLAPTNLIIGGIPVIQENMEAVMVQDPTSQRYKPNCDKDIVSHMQKIIEQYPEYPFSYLVMSWCTKEYEYEFELIKHLTAIISLPNHTPDHDNVWGDLSDKLTWKGLLLRYFPFFPISAILKL